jgi:hypothetical protein
MDEDAKQLLREIRDLLAKREEQYEQYLIDVKKIYAEQEAARRKSLRIVLALFVLLAVFIAIGLAF